MNDSAEPGPAVRAACLRYLARREYGRAELRHKLLAKPYPEDIVDQVIADLAGEGLVSDARFAEVFARGRVEKGYGPMRIRAELRLRGIARDDVPALADVESERLIDQVYAKKFGETLPDSLPERAARERFLARRGFGRDQIRRLFRRLREGGPE